MVNDIPPMIGDTGFPYFTVMQHQLEVIAALKVPEIIYGNDIG